MVAIRAFSGLVSSACALARAAAIAPMDSLDRCMAVLLGEKIETNRARLRALRPNAMAGRLLGVRGNESLELGLGAFMVEKGGARGAEEPGELRPRVGLAHVDHPDRFDPRPRRLDAIRPRGLAGLHAAPEAPLG